MQKMLKSSSALALLAAVTSYITILAALYYTDGIFWIFSSGIMGLVLWCCLAVFYRQTLGYINRRLGWTSFFGGALLAAFHSVGEMLFTQFTIARLPIKWAGYTLLYMAVLCQLFYHAQRWQNKPERQRGTLGQLAGRVFGPSLRSLFLVAGLLLLLWLPYYLLNWPGLVSPDIKTQMLMWLGKVRFTTHHPIVHTAFLGLSLQLGRLLGNEALGIGLATLVQVVLLSFVVSAALRQMAVLKTALIWRVMVFFVYGLLPVFGWYATTLWKDVWLAAFALLFYLAVVELCRQGRCFLLPGGG